jgi:hypothetical protein
MQTEAIVACFRQCSSVFLDGPRKSAKNLRIVAIPTDVRTPFECQSETLVTLLDERMK